MNYCIICTETTKNEKAWWIDDKETTKEIPPKGINWHADPGSKARISRGKFTKMGEKTLDFTVVGQAPKGIST